MKRTIALFVTITGVEDQQAARRLTVLLAVMISALILRSAFLALAVTEQGIESLSRATPDSRAYLLMAGNLHGSGQPAESQFFDFGIGYALFLAATLPLGGVWLAIAIQLLLSTLAVGGIYVLGRRLNLEHNTALLGAVLSAISMTSINLSVLILSDTLFFFLILFGTIVLLGAFKSRSFTAAILAGGLIGYAILTRSIGQFWLLVILFVGILWPRIEPEMHSPAGVNSTASRSPLRLTLIVCAISVALMSVWITRNYQRIGVPILASTSALGGANVALWAVAREEGVTVEEIRRRWLSERDIFDTSAQAIIAQNISLYTKKTVATLKKTSVSDAPRIPQHGLV